MSGGRDPGGSNDKSKVTTNANGDQPKKPIPAPDKLEPIAKVTNLPTSDADYKLNAMGIHKTNPNADWDVKDPTDTDDIELETIINDFNDIKDFNDLDKLLGELDDLSSDSENVAAPQATPEEQQNFENFEKLQKAIQDLKNALSPIPENASKGKIQFGGIEQLKGLINGIERLVIKNATLRKRGISQLPTFEDLKQGKATHPLENNYISLTKLLYNLDQAIREQIKQASDKQELLKIQKPLNSAIENFNEAMLESYSNLIESVLEQSEKKPTSTHDETDETLVQSFFGEPPSSKNKNKPEASTPAQTSTASRVFNFFTNNRLARILGFSADKTPDSKPDAQKRESQQTGSNTKPFSETPYQPIPKINEIATPTTQDKTDMLTPVELALNKLGNTLKEASKSNANLVTDSNNTDILQDAVDNLQKILTIEKSKKLLTVNDEIQLAYNKLAIAMNMVTLLAGKNSDIYKSVSGDYKNVCQALTDAYPGLLPPQANNAESPQRTPSPTPQPATTGTEPTSSESKQTAAPTQPAQNKSDTTWENGQFKDINNSLIYLEEIFGRYKAYHLTVTTPAESNARRAAEAEKAQNAIETLRKVLTEGLKKENTNTFTPPAYNSDNNFATRLHDAYNQFKAIETLLKNDTLGIKEIAGASKNRSTTSDPFPTFDALTTTYHSLKNRIGILYPQMNTQPPRQPVNPIKSASGIPEHPFMPTNSQRPTTSAPQSMETEMPPPTLRRSLEALKVALQNQQHEISKSGGATRTNVYEVIADKVDKLIKVITAESKEEKEESLSPITINDNSPLVTAYANMQWWAHHLAPPASDDVREKYNEVFEQIHQAYPNLNQALQQKNNRLLPPQIQHNAFVEPSKKVSAQSEKPDSTQTTKAANSPPPKPKAELESFAPYDASANQPKHQTDASAEKENVFDTSSSTLDRTKDDFNSSLSKVKAKQTQEETSNKKNQRPINNPQAPSSNFKNLSELTHDDLENITGSSHSAHSRRKSVISSDASSETSSTNSVSTHYTDATSDAEPVDSHVDPVDPVIDALNKLIRLSNPSAGGTFRHGTGPFAKHKDQLKVLEGINTLRNAYDAASKDPDKTLRYDNFVKAYNHFADEIVPLFTRTGEITSTLDEIKTNIESGHYTELGQQRLLLGLRDNALLNSSNGDSAAIQNAKMHVRQILELFAGACDPRKRESMTDEEAAKYADLLAANLCIVRGSLRGAEVTQVDHAITSIRAVLNKQFSVRLEGSIHKKIAIHNLDATLKNSPIADNTSPDDRVKLQAAKLRARATLHDLYWKNTNPSEVTLKELAVDLIDAGVALDHPSVNAVRTNGYGGIPNHDADLTATRTALNLEDAATLAPYEALQAQLFTIQGILPDTSEFKEHIYAISDQLDVLMKKDPEDPTAAQAHAQNRSNALVELADHLKTLENYLKSNGKAQAHQLLIEKKQAVFEAIKTKHGLLPPTDNHLRAHKARRYLTESKDDPKHRWYETYEGDFNTKGKRVYGSEERDQNVKNALTIARHVHERMGSFKELTLHYLHTFKNADGLRNLSKEELQKYRQHCAQMKMELEAYIHAAEAEKRVLGDKGRRLIRNSSSMTIEDGLQCANDCVKKLSHVLNVLATAAVLTKPVEAARVVSFANKSEAVANSDEAINAKIQEFSSPEEEEVTSSSTETPRVSGLTAARLNEGQAVVNRHLVNQYDKRRLGDTPSPDKHKVVTVQKHQDGRYISQVHNASVPATKLIKPADAFDLARDIVEEYINLSDKVCINKSPRAGEKVWRGEPLELKGKYDKQLLLAILAYCEQQKYAVTNCTRIDIKPKEIAKFAEQVEKDRPRQKARASEEEARREEEQDIGQISRRDPTALTPDEQQRAKNRPPSQVQALTKEVLEIPGTPKPRPGR